MRQRTKQNGRKVKRKLAMTLSLLLIVGLIAETMPMQVIAENDINASEESLTNTPEVSNEGIDSKEEMTTDENRDENENAYENENTNENKDDTFGDENLSDDAVTSDEQEEDEVQPDVPADSKQQPDDPYMEEGETFQSLKSTEQADPEVSYSTDSGQTWVQDSLNNVFWNVMGEKTVEIKLLRDVTLGNDVPPQMLAYNDQTVTLNGDGHTIARTGNNSMIIVSQPGSELILKNITIDGGAVWSEGSPEERVNTGISSGGNGHLLWVYGGGTLILDEGAVIKNSHMTGNFYGAIQLGYNGTDGTLIMKSGAVIRDCAAQAGAAVNVGEGSFFRMEGGKIYNNYASVYGGSGVNCYGSFSMSGGEISGNTAANLGGGVCAMGSGTASMSGGSISGNHSKKYGGGVGIRDNGSFIMTAGSIEGNTSESYGGGVIVFHDTSLLYMSGGNISGNTSGGVFVYQGQIKVDGNPVITGNSMNGTPNNLYLSSGRTITISGALGESASISVTANEGIISSGWNAQMNTDKRAGDYFCSDKETLTIDKDTASNEVRLSAKSEGTKGIITEEVKKEGTTPEVKVPVWPVNLEETVLTDEEKTLVANGTNAIIRLVVADADNSVNKNDKAAVETVLNGFTPGQYLDISLFKIIGENRSAISETSGKIRITITIPDNLKNTDGIETRAYAVIRVHNGTAQVLPDQDASSDTITIETDRFSTYAIVYKDTTNAGGGGTGNGGEGGNSSSVDGSDSEDRNDSDVESNDSKDRNGSGVGGSDSGDGNSSGNDNSNNNSNNGINGNNDNGNHNNTTPNNKKASKQSKDQEPQTGDNTPLELYATLAMIGGLSYLLLYFTDHKRGITEETKKELVSGLVAWAKQGGRIRKIAALIAIFILLVYYHSIGKKTAVQWKAVYGE